MNLLPYHISYIKWIVAWVAIVVYLLQLFLMKLFTCINFWFFNFPKVLFTSRMYTCVLKHRIRIYEMIMQLLLTKLFTSLNFWFFNLLKVGRKVPYWYFTFVPGIFCRSGFKLQSIIVLYTIYKKLDTVTWCIKW